MKSQSKKLKSNRQKKPTAKSNPDINVPKKDIKTEPGQPTFLPSFKKHTKHEQKEMSQMKLDIFTKEEMSPKEKLIDGNGRKITGYTIYNAEQERRTKRNDLPSLYPDLPEKKFDIIYADPPWDYNGKMQFDNSGKAENFDINKKIFISSATFKYPTLKTKEMMKIPLTEIAKDDCLLFLWATNPHLQQAIELGSAWGFNYRTVAFIWDKMNHNPGQYTMSNCELCLVFKRGKIPTPRGARNVQQLIRSPRKEHSEKPVEVIQAIERMFPTQDRIELFARNKPKGWSVWGLDVQEEH